MHPPTYVEGIQYRSSDNITQGLNPDPSSKGILKLGNKKDECKGLKKKKTIWAEFNKVSNEEHKKFYSSVLGKSNFNLFVVSNKPLENYEEIKKAVAENNYTKHLPRGVSVICHQNFKTYAGPFAHQGLYLSLKRK